MLVTAAVWSIAQHSLGTPVLGPNENTSEVPMAMPLGRLFDVDRCPTQAIPAQQIAPPAFVTAQHVQDECAYLLPTPNASPIPTVQAFAAANGGVLPRTLIYDSEDVPAGEQTLIPLPPAGWSGLIGLATLASASGVRKFRKMR
jgi:hypothetical protein